MIAVDTSTISAYLEGLSGRDVAALEQGLLDKQIVLPPIVLSELWSNPQRIPAFMSALDELPVLEIADGFWKRAGVLRAGLIARGHKARLADTLIAQSCIDHRVALITRDDDFRHFVRLGGLRLLP